MSLTNRTERTDPPQRVFKFLVQVEFGERTAWDAHGAYDAAKFARRLESAAEEQARLATTGPEPRVTVIEEETREAEKLKAERPV